MAKREKYVPIEKCTDAEVRAKIDGEYAKWDKVFQHGCNDPFWADGSNLNLIRNHIVYYREVLYQRRQAKENVQLSLFGDGIEIGDSRPLPPKVPETFMCPNGAHLESRLRTIGKQNVVFSV
jgi:hypothetical protein